MAEKKVTTTMVLKVDLQCPSCYKKVKKLLCKFPQIRNQIFDEKQNTVTITVVCCSPEKIRDKLCCKGGKTIKCIQTVEPPKPEPPKKTKDPKSAPPPLPSPPKEDSPPPPPPPSPPKKNSPPPPPSPPKEDPAPMPVAVCCEPCSEGRAGGPCYHGYGRPVPIYTPNPTVPICPPVHQREGPTGICCGPCSEGRAGGPCYHGYGRPVPVPVSTPNPTVPVCPPVHQRGGPVRVCCEPCSEGRAGGPCYHGYGRLVPVLVPTPKPPSPKAPKTPPSPPQPVPVCPPVHQIGAPAGVCCGSCYEGRAGGPCYHGYGRLVSWYDGYYGYGGGRVCHVSRCDDYFSDENATGCTIM